MKPIISKIEADYPEEQDQAIIKIGDCILTISAPFGHTLEDLSIRYRGESGWQEIEEGKINL